MTEPEHADLIGRLIKATPFARGKRAVQGVVLPPVPGTRKPTVRLAVDGRRAPIPFDPTVWDVAVLAGPLYGFGSLPAEHLATKTMLKAERRLRPATGQLPIGDYAVRDGCAPLYAVADAEPLPALPPVRAAAWTAARTCVRCGESKPRPLNDYRGAGRLCGPCQKTVATERWIEQSRATQADAGKWARGLLADPTVLLMARDNDFDRPAVRIEWLTLHSGIVPVFDGRLRKSENPEEVIHDTPYWTQEEIQRLRDRYAGTIAPSAFRDAVRGYGETRVVGWNDRDRWIDVLCDLPWIAPADEVGDRLALWSGIAPRLYGHQYWYPEPTMPWNRTANEFPLYHVQSHIHAGNLPAQIAKLQMLIHIMAGSPAPEPTVPTDGTDG